MDKYLYFATGDGANATAEAVMMPLSSFQGADPIDATSLLLFFKPQQIGGAVATGDVVDQVDLTITSNTHKKVMNDIVKAINAPGIGNKDGFIVVCDADNTVFASSDISDCAITLAA
tara:strand:- start:665 stop:1015 length:351 start_codon:yes stop_codon:yes gene_type:complete